MTGASLSPRELTPDDIGPDVIVSAGEAVAPPPWLLWLDPARGVAILFVVAYHTLGYLAQASRFHGEAGVDAFLLLSGFGLAYATRPEPLARFAWRRLTRLLPAYWIVLALCTLHFWSQGIHLGWRQLLLHATCLHLFPGDEYGFGISMSYWFIGLIVPLYVWFALLRPWVLGRHAYSVLGVSLALATIGGQLLLKFHPDWGNSSIGHVPHRLPQFFLGAIVGLAYARRDTPERVAREPLLLLGLAVFVGLIVWFDWMLVPFFLLGGAGIVAIGMLVTALGGRWRIGRPGLAAIGVLGALAYEVYLCHQFLIMTVLPSELMPKLVAWLPRLPHQSREMILALLAFPISLWVAWTLRWLVAFRESKRSWRPALRTLLAITLIAGGATALLARQPSPPKTRTFELTITPPRSPVPACIEPILYFKGFRRADLLFIEHDGNGQARFRLDHWGLPSLFSNWMPAQTLTAGKVNVIISGEFFEVRSAAATVRTTAMPYAPKAWPVIGTNDLNLAGIELKAKSDVVLSPTVVRSKR